QDSVGAKTPAESSVGAQPSENAFSKKDGQQVKSTQDPLLRSKHVDATYKIVSIDDGLFIVVTSSEGLGKPIKYEKIAEDLRRAGLKQFDTEALKNSCKPQSGGTPIKICNAAVIPQSFKLQTDAAVKLVVDKSKMVASVIVEPPFNGGADVNFAQIDSVINAASVRAPIIKEAVARVVRDKLYNEPVMVASGMKPVSGEDGYIKWYFETHAQKVEIFIDESGNVDYHKVLKINTVNAGELIGEKILSKPGMNGYNVFKEPIPAKQPREINFIPGKNTEITEDGNHIKATVNGQLIIKNNNASVMPVYEVKGDVDFNVGNIDFNGSVLIQGTILDGFSVKAEGNVEVRKTVNSAVIEARGNVILHGGFIGKEHGLIKAGGKIGAKFLQGGNIISDDEIIIENAIMHSNVVSGKQIIVKGKKASIIGGRIFASEYVEALSIGTPAGTKTVIEVGVDILKEQEIVRLDQDVNQTNEYIKKISTSIVTLTQIKAKTPGRFSEAQEEILKRTLSTKDSLQVKLQELEEQKKQLLNEIMTSQKGKVVATNSFYPGVTVIIRKYFKYEVKDAIKCSALGIENGDIRILPV
ncbi:MAG TPA: FapA family protein, partial [Candidatus Wallbacteria bacterium]|nr:FapA family protein [Candidatus Wallbacteria bacterium]